MARPRIHLIDAHVYIFRAYHSLPAMHAPDGTPTHAAYGFANTLIRYLAEVGPSHLACCFDHGPTSFRNERFPGYKASRLVPPEDLEPQFALCGEAARALGIASFEQAGYEADDLIATLTATLRRERAEVVVVTTDKDLAQLVTEDGGVVLHDLARGTTLDADAVRARFGVDPAQIPDYLGLMGDAVDELPGVPGVGPKGAAAALQAFGSLDAMPTAPESWDAVAARGARRLGERIAAHRDQARQTRELATLVADVPGLEAATAELAWDGADRGRMEALCARLGWGRIATRVPRWSDENG